MKSIIAVAGLLCLAACSHRTPEQDAVHNNAAALEASLEAQADNMEALADATANQAAAQAIENAADNLQDARDNVADAADARMHNLR